MYQAAKMMIASNGRQSAVLLDGVMIGVGIDGIRLDVKEGVAELSITGIDVERFRAGNAPDCQGMNWAENDSHSFMVSTGKFSMNMIPESVSV